MISGSVRLPLWESRIIRREICEEFADALLAAEDLDSTERHNASRPKYSFFHRKQVLPQGNLTTTVLASESWLFFFSHWSFKSLLSKNGQGNQRQLKVFELICRVET